MKKDTFISLAAHIFSLVAICHLLRAIYSWPLTVNNWEIPLWVSYAVFLLLGYLAYNGFTILKKK